LSYTIYSVHGRPIRIILQHNGTNALTGTTITLENKIRDGIPVWYRNDTIKSLVMQTGVPFFSHVIRMNACT